MNPFLEALRRINELKVPYLAVGGFSVVMHGVNRFTPDLNLMADLNGDAPRNLVEGLRAYDLTTEEESSATAFCTEVGRESLCNGGQQWCLPFRDPELPNFSVDIFLKHPAAFEELYERRVEVDFAGCVVPMISLEDLIVLKLIANRGQDKADIENLLVIQDIREFADDEQKCREYIESRAKASLQDQVENLIQFYRLPPTKKAEWLAEMLAQLGKFCLL